MKDDQTENEKLIQQVEDTTLMLTRAQRQYAVAKVEADNSFNLALTSVPPAEQQKLQAIKIQIDRLTKELMNGGNQEEIIKKIKALEHGY